MAAEVKNGVLTIDHIAIPVRDLDPNQDFYINVLGLKYKTTRRNPDGSPRQTYVLAGDNIIGLHLPGINAGASPALFLLAAGTAPVEASLTGPLGPLSST